jgi:hypothetical protein
MGGFGSGPSGGRPTVQDALSLDINQLRHDRFIRPGQGWGGALKWSDPYTGRNSSSVGYESHLGTEQGRLRLVYTRTGSDGTKQNADYWIDLATTAQPLVDADGGSSARKPRSSCPSSISRLGP